MGALDTAKEIARMTSTASLGKDVIDLLKEKIALLSEQVSALETENKNLKAKAYDLEQELANLRPKDAGLDDTAKQFIKILFEAGGFVDFERAAASIGVPKGKAAYYLDVLFKAGMIRGAGMIVGNHMGAYELNPDGREYAVKNGLA